MKALVRSGFRPGHARWVDTCSAYRVVRCLPRLVPFAVAGSMAIGCVRMDRGRDGPGRFGHTVTPVAPGWTESTDEEIAAT